MKDFFGRQFSSAVSIDEQRRITLGTWLIVVYFLIDLFFFVVNLFNPSGDPWIFIGGVVLAVVSFVFMRRGWVDVSIFVFMLRGNSTVFYFALLDEGHTGTYLYFLSLALTALVFYGYRHRYKGIAYAIISVSLFLISQLNVEDFRPDHAHFYFITNFMFVGCTAGFILLFLDRVNRSAEVEIRQKNAALQKANEELDRFVYHASHDLRAPLSSIMGLTAIYNLEKSEEGRAQAVKMIADRAQKLDVFIKEVLSYSQNARTEVTSTAFYLKAVIDECQEAIRYLPNFDSVKFKIEVAPDFPITSDPVRWKIILSNLLSNAIKYADLTKPDPFIAIRAQRKGKLVEVVVEDNGIGIHQRYHDQLFSMFFRAHFQSDGSGLGLYIVRECVEKINGRIGLDSVHGKGTKLTVELPV